MADLTARFRLIDELSDKLSSMAERGRAMLSSFENAGSAANATFGEMDSGMSSAVSSADGVATSISNIGSMAGGAATSTENLADSMGQYEDAASNAAEKTDFWTDAVGNYDKGALEAIYTTEELVEMGFKSADALEAEQQAMHEAEQAASRLSDTQAELGKQTEETSEQSENAGKTGIDAIKAVSSSLIAAGITNLIGEIASALMDTVAASAQVETAFAKLQTIAGEGSMNVLSDQIKGLSSETGIAQDTLADVAYNAISAGSAVEDAVGTAGAAAKLAAAGFTDTSSALSVLSTTMNSYGDAAGDATDISNSLIMVQNLGVTTVAQLAASMGKSISTASAYNVSLGNLESAYVSVTKAGINTAEASTYISGMLTELGKEGSNVSNILKEQTGQSFGQLMNAGYSLAEVLGILYDAVGNDTEALMNLWGTQTAGVASAAIINQGLEQFNNNLIAIENSAGAAESAYATMASTTEHSQKQMQNSIENLQVSIGDALAPTLQKFYDLGSKAFGWMADLVADHPAVVKAATAIGVGLSVAAVAIVGVSVASATAIPAVAALGTAISAAIWPITAIAAAVTAVTAAVFFLIDAFKEDLGETEGMTAATREQYYAVQDLNAEYDEAVTKYGETDEEVLRLKYELDDLTASFEANRQTVEEFSAEADTLCQNVNQLSDDFDSALTDINSQEIGSLALIQKYQDLTEATKLTGAQQNELEAITKKLSESYPELTAQLDKGKLSAEDYASAIKHACEQQAEEQRQQQAQQAYVDALVKRAELTEEIAKAQKNISLEQQRMDNMDGWTHFWTGGEWDDLEAYQAALKELQAAEEENNATIEEIEQQWQNVADAEAESAEGTMSYQEAVSNAYSSVRSDVEELCTAYEEAYNAASESLEGQFGLFDKASMSSEEYLNSTVANAQAALDSQLAYWDSYLANIQTLKDTSAQQLGITQENYELLMSYVQDGSEEAAGLANSIVKQIQKGNTEAVAELANTAGEVQSTRNTIAAETADWQTNFNATMDELVKKMDSTVDGLNLDKEAAASAKATIDAYAKQIRTSGGSAVQAAQDIATQVSVALSRAKTTVDVNVSAPGHARGTTNAENAFIAGEKGPELIVHTANAYASGTTNSSDFYLAGEYGPELIIGQQGSTVFPTEETDRIINALDDRRRPLNIAVDNYKANPQINAPSGYSSLGEQVKRIILEVVGSGKIEVGGSSSDNNTILEILQENIRPVLMQILSTEVYEEGELSYEY